MTDQEKYKADAELEMNELIGNITKLCEGRRMFVPINALAYVFIGAVRASGLSFEQTCSILNDVWNSPTEIVVERWMIQ